MQKLTTSIFTFVSLFCLSGCSKDASSIGIIGGADGPTAIFVTSNVNCLHIGGVLAVIVLAILVALMIRKKK